MNITLPSASKFKRKTKEVEKTKKISMETIVERFINSEVQSAIERSSYPSINVEVPFDAYGDLNLFYALCDKALAPLGYKSADSHDGGGMYNTLCVSW